jgi:hypothetical protein
VTVGNADVQCGLIVNRLEVEPVVPFEAGDDWLENITMHLLNRTNKTIVSAEIRLEFPETGDGSPEKPIQTDFVQLGRKPAQAAYGRNGKPLSQRESSRFISFAPAKTLVIRVGDHTDVTPDLKPLRKCIIRVTRVYFLDGMGWDFAGYYDPDPEQHGKFTRMGKMYFPGEVQDNWPPPYRK